MKSIVVGTDFSKGSYVALDIAVDIANKLDCGIRLVWVRKEKNLLDHEQLKMITRLAEQRLQELCEERRHLLKNPMEWEILPGKVSEVMSKIARQVEAPMIVIGTNGASGFEKYWMGSTAVRIIQESTCPVLTIREGYDFHKTLERIIVPIRVHIDSRQKVAPAVEMAKIFNSSIHIVGISASQQDDFDLKTYIKQIEKFLANEHIPMTSEIRPYSNYADIVLDVAEKQHADLIVINTEQDRFLAQLFLGTNAQQLVHRAQIPVLCLHPKDIVTLAK